jgi:hypothetical protein
MQLEPRQFHLQPVGDEIEHRPIVDLKPEQAGNDGRGEVAVVAEDVDALALVGSAEDRFDALRAQHIQLGIGRSGDDDALLAAPNRNGSIMENRLLVAREQRDPNRSGGDGGGEGANSEENKE